jgi:hypothetical protein
MMGKKLTKAVALTAVGGVGLGWWGCGDSWWQALLVDAALSAGYEFVWDNDSVFDLFQDDFGTGANYDDRFTANPTRDEPDGTVFPRN